MRKYENEPGRMIPK